MLNVRALFNFFSFHFYLHLLFIQKKSIMNKTIVAFSFISLILFSDVLAVRKTYSTKRTIYPLTDLSIVVPAPYKSGLTKRNKTHENCKTAKKKIETKQSFVQDQENKLNAQLKIVNARCTFADNYQLVEDFADKYPLIEETGSAIKMPEVKKIVTTKKSPVNLKSQTPVKPKTKPVALAQKNHMDTPAKCVQYHPNTPVARLMEFSRYINTENYVAAEKFISELLSYQYARELNLLMCGKINKTIFKSYLEWTNSSVNGYLGNNMIKHENYGLMALSLIKKQSQNNSLSDADRKYFARLVHYFDTKLGIS